MLFYRAIDDIKQVAFFLMIVPRDQCSDVVDRQCHTSYVDECNYVQRSICNDVLEVDVDRPVQSQVCEDVPVENCVDVPTTVFKDVARL